MSTATTTVPHWMPAEELHALGFAPAGPEIDFGMQWGENRAVRVSYAPRAGRDDGFLYAYDKTRDRYLLLAGSTTPDSVQAAWQELINSTAAPDAYLALAALDEQPLPLPQARALLLHCADREFAAYRDFSASGNDPRTRVTSAHAVVVQRSARVAAEQILADSAKLAAGETPPAVVRYRVPAERGWTGRVAGSNLQTAVDTLRCVRELADHHGVAVQATSVAHGHTTVAATRVPELNFARHSAPAVPGAPRLEL